MSDRPNVPHFRAQARQPVNMPGALLAAAEAGGSEQDVRVVDLGLGGARVAASDILPAGTAIELVIDTPHLWDALTLSGAVVWSEPKALAEGTDALLGVRFDHVSGSTARKLTELLEAERFA